LPALLAPLGNRRRTDRIVDLASVPIQAELHLAELGADLQGEHAIADHAYRMDVAKFVDD
jgi:hypothetical protein